MNKQFARNNSGLYIPDSKIGWTNIHWNGTAYVLKPGTGYTWPSVVGGCPHECRWKMPDGTIAVCYAEAQAERMRSDKFFPEGFKQHYWRPDRLDAPQKLKEPSGIFVDAMSDLMSHFVKTDQIDLVIQAMRENPQHIFFVLTKMPKRLLKFSWPPNVWLLFSSPPDFMNGQPLSRKQQIDMLITSLETMQQLRKTNVVGASIEPLSWNVTDVIKLFPDALDWAIVGAASRGGSYFQPHHDYFIKLMNYAAKNGLAIHHKGNIRPTLDALGMPFLELYPQRRLL